MNLKKKPIMDKKKLMASDFSAVQENKRKIVGHR